MPAVSKKVVVPANVTVRHTRASGKLFIINGATTDTLCKTKVAIVSGALVRPLACPSDELYNAEVAGKTAADNGRGATDMPLAAFFVTCRKSLPDGTICYACSARLVRRHRLADVVEVQIVACLRAGVAEPPAYVFVAVVLADGTARSWRRGSNLAVPPFSENRNGAAKVLP